MDFPEFALKELRSLTDGSEEELSGLIDLVKQLYLVNPSSPWKLSDWIQFFKDSKLTADVLFALRDLHCSGDMHFAYGLMRAIGEGEINAMQFVQFLADPDDISKRGVLINTSFEGYIDILSTKSGSAVLAH